MSVGKIRGFLIRTPKPAQIRVTAGDGAPQEIKIGRSMAKTAESIDALDVELIECLDGNGNLLRAMRLGSDDATRSDAADIPAGIAADPDALMLTHFANLLHRAYEHSTEVAFSRIVEVVDVFASHAASVESRLARTESELRRTKEEQIDDALERAQEALEKSATGENGELMQQMALAWLQGKAQTVPPAPKSNGTKNGRG